MLLAALFGWFWLQHRSDRSESRPDRWLVVLVGAIGLALSLAAVSRAATTVPHFSPGGVVQQLGSQTPALGSYEISLAPGRHDQDVAAPLARPFGTVERLAGDALLSTASSGAGKALPMNMQTVCEVACKYNVDISDVTININKARAGYAGSTASDGTITLTRSAFANEEQLARTLAHERFHVDQIRSGRSYPTTYDSSNAWEQAARAFENDWWAGQ